MTNISSNFIIESLKSISDSINGISIRYAYDEITDFHIVEISPESIRRGLSKYINLENKLWSDFYNLFPEEDILISNVSELNNMSNILFEVQSFTNASASSYTFRYNDSSVNENCNINSNLIAAA